MSFFLIIILLVNFIESQQFTEINELSLSSCILNSNELFSEKSGDTLGIYIPLNKSTSSNLIRQLSRTRNFSLILINNQRINKIVTPTDHLLTDTLIVYFFNVEQLKRDIEVLRKLNLLDSLSKLLLVVKENLTDKHKSIAQNISELIYMKQIRYFMLFIMDKEDMSKYHIYVQKSKCNSSNKIEEIGSCTHGNYQYKSTWHNGTILPIRNCKIDIMYSHFPPYVIDMDDTMNEDIVTPRHGEDILFIANILQKLNFTFKFHRAHNRGSIFADYSGSGLLKYLLEEDNFIGLGGYSVTNDRLALFENVPYATETLVWATPQEWSHKVKELNVQLFTDADIWIVMLVLIICVSILVVISGRQSPNELLIYKDPISAIKTVIFLMTNVTVPLPKSSHTRMIISFILFFALAINSVYQTYLISILTETTKYKTKSIKLKDIIKRNITIYFSRNANRLFRSANPMDIILLNRSQICDTPELPTCLNEIIIKHNASMYSHKRVLNFHLSKAHAKELSILKEGAVSYPVVFLMPKRFWAFKLFYDMMGRAISAGLLGKWRSMVEEMMKSNGIENPFDNEQTNYAETKILHFSDLHGMCFCFLAWQLVAILVFVMEIIVHGLTKKFTKYDKNNQINPMP